MNNVSLASALLFEPRKAFAEIDARPRFWFPLLLLIASAVIVAVWYRSVVDLEWVTDRAIRSSSFASRLTEAQIEETIKRQSANPTMGTVLTAVATPIIILLVGLLSTVYMMLAGKITNVQRSFRQWFSLTWWTGLPSLLSTLGAVFVLLTATTSQIDQAELKPLSLNALFFQRAFNEPGYTLLSSIDLIQIFCLFLLVAGVRAWSGRSWLFSAIFALLPYALIYGVWAFVSLR
jgi:uncharacterized membrane protein